MRVWRTSSRALALVAAVLAAGILPLQAEAASDGPKVRIGHCRGPVQHCGVADLKWVEGSSGAWLGIMLQDITPGLKEALDLGEQAGALVSDVVDDSPAAEAGLKPGDVIFRVDDRDIEDAGDLVEYVHRKAPGNKIQVHYLRDGKEQSKEITLDEHESKMHKVIEVGDDRETQIFGLLDQPRLGVVVQPLDEDMAPYFDLKPGGGVLVTRVIEDTPADEAKIKSGDVIVRIEDEQIEDADDIREVLGDHEAGDQLKVEIVRKGKSKNIEVELDEGHFTNLVGRHFLPFMDKGGVVTPGPDDVYLHRYGQKDLDKIKEELRELRREMKQLKRKMESGS